MLLDSIHLYFFGPDGEPDSSFESGDSDSDGDDDFRRQLIEWREGEEEILEFPASLTPFDRKTVHEIAESLGLRHRSIGIASNRRIVVQPPTADQDCNPLPEAQIPAPHDPPTPVTVSPPVQRASKRARKTPAHLRDYVS